MAMMETSKDNSEFFIALGFCYWFSSYSLMAYSSRFMIVVTEFIMFKNFVNFENVLVKLFVSQLTFSNTKTICLAPHICDFLSALTLSHNPSQLENGTIMVKPK
jgi:hypothetical protein